MRTERGLLAVNGLLGGGVGRKTEKKTGSWLSSRLFSRRHRCVKAMDWRGVGLAGENGTRALSLEPLLTDCLEISLGGSGSKNGKKTKVVEQGAVQ